jgi:hypothetical protein
MTRTVSRYAWVFQVKRSLLKFSRTTKEWICL